MEGFAQADRRYDELKRRYAAGSLDAEAFNGELEKLKLRDSQNRWWAKGADGEWYYYDGSGWVQGTPEGYQKVVDNPRFGGAPVSNFSASQSVHTPQPASPSRSNQSLTNSNPGMPEGVKILLWIVGFVIGFPFFAVLFGSCLAAL